MKLFNLPLADNVLGSDSLANLYIAINKAFPELGLTKDNSTIVKIQPAVSSTYPTLTYLKIQKGDDQGDTYELFYNRYNITNYLVNPLFTTAELVAVKKLTNSADLVEYIAKKFNHNFRAEDFWTSINSIELAGGSTPPNWYMEAVYDSIYWTGSMYVWLHT